MNYGILAELRQVFLDRGGMSMLPERVKLDLGVHVTHGTNAIEGNTLTLEEVRTVVSGLSVGGKPMREILETIQHERVFRTMLIPPFPEVSMMTMLQLHDGVFHGILHDAGQWRRVNVKIVGSSHTPPRMEKVMPMLESLITDYRQADLEGDDVMALGAMLHHRFESIHPFSDGNGRIGRLLLNLHFLRHNWPPISLTIDDRVEYMRCLESGGNGDLVPLQELLQVKAASSLLCLLDQIGIAQDELLPLSQLAPAAGHSAKYLSLRCQQGALPGVKEKNVWRSSKRALALYHEHMGRG